MIILMRRGADQAQVGAAMLLLEQRGLRALNLPGSDQIAIGVASAIAPDVREGLANALISLDGVDHVVHVSRPYKLVSREFHAASTVVRVRDVEIGGGACVIIAGP